MRHRSVVTYKQPRKETDWWYSLPKQQKKDIEAGLSDLVNGKKKDFAKVISKYK